MAHYRDQGTGNGPFPGLFLALAEEYGVIHVTGVNNDAEVTVTDPATYQ
jgi:hypothetical protein